MRFCVDCKHHFSGRCESPNAEPYRDCVTGQYPTCEEMRKPFSYMGWGNGIHCDIDGCWFEPTFQTKEPA